MAHNSKVVGRYAPSPTGQLHLGNLRTALLAWLSTRCQEGKFLLRMEDIDTPRVVQGSADQILRDLQWLGLDWDEVIMVQSARTQAYQQALTNLQQQGLVYPCYCSRKEIQQSSSAPHGETPVYAGTCRSLTTDQQDELAKLKSPSYRVVVSEQLQAEVGDFVIKRADGLFAYQLAVVVDDLAQGVTEVVRGADLASSTSRQQYLLNKISKHEVSINYYHAPLMLDESGLRMSKRDGSKSIRQWQQSGRNAPQLLAYLANSLGMKIDANQIELADLLARTDLNFLRRVFNNEN